jgi:hypothetical protein
MTSGRRGAAGSLALTLALGLLPAPGARPSVAHAAQSPAPSLAAARLEGTFALAGTVTVAQDIPGERPGRHYLRTWRFTAPCRSGSCSTAKLVRRRAGATDRLTLRRRGADFYSGSGRFYAPARCGSRTYPNGILVPFTIAVRVTAVGPNSAGILVAKHVRAQYTNSSRTNLTPCVSALGHDAASYHGHLVSDP